MKLKGLCQVMCHSGETNSSIHDNRKDDEYYKQLNQ